MLIKASAPGSLMLLGEYAVLHNKTAIVCAIDKRITVILSPRLDRQITIDSVLLKLTTSLEHLHRQPPLQFLIAILQAYKNKMRYGCDIKVVADFSATVGFGSSAALTVAMVKAVTEWLEISLTPIELVVQARKIIRSVQGLGSGADVAASVFGGVIAYRAAPLLIENIAQQLPLTVVYSGSKTPTSVAVAKVKEKFHKYPKILRTLLRSIGACAEDARQAILAEDSQRLGEVMNIQQGLMTSLGVENTVLQRIVNLLCADENIFGAKISGSGLGDCVVGLGHTQKLILPAEMTGVVAIPVAIAEHGVLCEKN
jgi:mevalonate kinase